MTFVTSRRATPPHRRPCKVSSSLPHFSLPRSSHRNGWWLVIVVATRSKREVGRKENGRSINTWSNPLSPLLNTTSPAREISTTLNENLVYLPPTTHQPTRAQQTLQTNHELEQHHRRWCESEPPHHHRCIPLLIQTLFRNRCNPEIVDRSETPFRFLRRRSTWDDWILISISSPDVLEV